MPPPCAQAPVTGVRMRVCDGDAAPDVSLSDATSARVHRTGALAGFAAVNVTVYCILPPTPPPAPPPSPPPPPPPPPDSKSTYEMWSKELSSNEENSKESESVESFSAELTTTVKPSAITTLPPPPQETTAQVELTSPAAVVTPPPYKMIQPKEKRPQSVQVTINITPGNQVSPKEGVPQSNDLELPSLSNKEKPDEMMPSPNPKFIETPPRMSELPPRKRIKRPRGWSRPGGARLPRLRPRAPPPPRYRPAAPLPPRYRPAAPPPSYMHSPQFGAMPPYELSQQYPVGPGYNPLSLIGPRLALLQRQQPLLIFRHF